MQQSVIHKPVLVNEVVHYLNPEPNQVYIDVTFGSGGHTQAILEAEPECRVIALDWDASALEKFGAPLQEKYGSRIDLIWANFAHLYKVLRKHKIEKVAGILADFGTSQVQLMEQPGFSFYKDTELDMRMSPSHQRMTAAQVLNNSSYEKLLALFFQLGEEKNSKRIVHAILQERDRRPFTTTLQLAQLIEKITPHYKQKKGIHPATKVFQALRIFVNQELENIHSFLPAAVRALKSQGRLVCISFHSLEDRIVKQFFLDQQRTLQATIISKKAIVASDEEIAQNPSARSAKLRVLEVL